MPYADPERQREANRIYSKVYYARNSDTEKARIYARKLELSAWLRKLKVDKTCNKCGENHPACLEFHHTDPLKKEVNLSAASTRGWSKKRILDEVRKCIVLCSNCHRKMHWDEEKEAWA